jgi:hypothetical protein
MHHWNDQAGDHNRDKTDRDDSRVSPDAQQSAQRSSCKIQQKQQSGLAIVQVKRRSE